MKNLPKIMAALILANLLASCSGNTSSTEKQSTSDNTTSASTLGTSSSNSDSITASTGTNKKTTIKASDSDTKKLTINDKCIGCGHCIREASKNFAMGFSHKAEVISQENINSTDVSNAISRCPVDAISIA